MYEQFYGLKADPFRLSADHRFCFDHRSYARAKAYVQYALYRAEGFVMVTGRPGTGKTTLINDLLASLPDKEFVAGTLVSTQLGAEDLLLMTGYAFGLDFHTTQKALVLQRLMEFLNQQHRQGLRTLLIIDEAQDLAPSALEELRLLTNLQRNGEPLLQIALLGQEALRELVRSRAMEQVQQRLIAAWQLDPLEPEETIGYVRHRLERAGWQGDPTFEPGVLRIVHEFSQGVPRRINLICSRLMLHGFIGERHTLTVEDAVTVARDLHREELARSDYQPDEALAHTLAPGKQGAGEYTASGSDSGDNVWSGIDHGLFWTAARKEPEHAGAPAEAPMASNAEPDEPRAETRVPESPGSDEARRESRVSKNTELAEEPAESSKPPSPEPAAAAAEESSLPPSPARGSAASTEHAFESEPAPAAARQLKTRAAAPFTPAGSDTDRIDTRAAETADSMLHIVPAKEEPWEPTRAAAGSGRWPSGKRRSRVLPRLVLMVLVAAAVVAALFLSRTTIVQESPVADAVSSSMISLERWWGKSSAAALGALQSLRAEIAGNGGAARDEMEADGADDASILTLPLREPGAGADAGRIPDGLRADSADPAAADRAPGDGVTAGAVPAPETLLESAAALPSRATADSRSAFPLESAARGDPTDTPLADTMAGDAAGATSPSVPSERAVPATPAASQRAEALIDPPAAPVLPDTTPDTAASTRAEAPAPAPAQPTPPLRDQPTQRSAPAESPEAAAPPNTPQGSIMGGPAVAETAAPEAPPLSGRVFFRVNSTTVDPQFEPLMDEVAEALAQSRESYAEIVGYTDTTGPTEFNRYLSNRRAEAVAEQLRERGIPGARLRIEGQGPREPETGEEGFRAEDRVVEITIRDTLGD